MEHQGYSYGHDLLQTGALLEPVLDRWAPEWRERSDDIGAVARLASTRVLDVAWHVDRDAAPQLVPVDVRGERLERVRISPALEELLGELAPIGAWPFGGGSWSQWLAGISLVPDAGITCILCITAQVAQAIDKYAPEHAARWMEPLASGGAWGATWMTEVQGGTDLGASTTIAEQVGDRWQLSGEKYFCSGAGLCDVAIVTARPPDAAPGARGTALFLVERSRPDGTLNWRVRRLKDKPATRAVPSGEVALEGSDACLVGDAAQGIYQTLENLTISRLANAAGACALLRAAQVEACLRARDRTIFGQRLVDQPLMRRDLLGLALRSAGSLVLTFRAAAAYEHARDDRPPFGQDYQLARFWSHLAKLRTAEHAVEGTRDAMEVFGGIGFVDDFAIARLNREAQVTAIWEGPANVQSLDLLESMGRSAAHEGFVQEVGQMLASAGSEAAARAAARLDALLAGIAEAGPEEAQWQAKTCARALADIAQVALLHDMARATGDDRWSRWADAYWLGFGEHGELPLTAASEPELWDVMAAVPAPPAAAGATGTPAG